MIAANAPAPANLVAIVDATEGGGSSLASWAPLYALLAVFVVIVAALAIVGRPPDSRSGAARLLLRVPAALEGVTGVPGWAAAAVGTSLFGLLVAGVGFYSDVAWHVALGRDDQLFTAPHTAIVIGLGLIFLGGAVGVMIATLARVETQLRWRGWRIPWSTLPLLSLGTGALLGFPLDELWHRTYGVDVTMWSPTHMLMILGASFTGIACWLVLAEANVMPKQSAWSRGVLVAAAWLTLQGLSAPLGEFSFGVPQFQQIFHPLLLCVASGFALVAIRLVHGRWWALGITVGNFAFTSAGFLSGGEEGPVETRAAGLFIASAVAVEGVAWLLGTKRPLRFAVAAGLGVGTLGLAGEWLWNQGAYQPWHAALLPDAAILGTIAAVASAVVGVAFARVVGLANVRSAVSRPDPRIVALAGCIVVLAIAIPMPRHLGRARATVTIGDQTDGRAHISVSLDPQSAAEDARWFQASAWQGGGLVLADMVELGRGRYVSSEPVPVGGRWKTLIRLHRGGELMTVPVFLPADPEIGEPEISAIDRTQRFESETEYLLRETHSGPSWFAYVVYGLLALVNGVWVLSFVVAGARLSRQEPLSSGRSVSAFAG